MGIWGHSCLFAYKIGADNIMLEEDLLLSKTICGRNMHAVFNNKVLIQ